MKIEEQFFYVPQKFPRALSKCVTVSLSAIYLTRLFRKRVARIVASRSAYDRVPFAVEIRDCTGILVEICFESSSLTAKSPRAERSAARSLVEEKSRASIKVLAYSYRGDGAR